MRFGEVTDYVRVASGAAKLEVKSAKGERLARFATELADGGRYTAVLLARDGGGTLKLYRDSRAPGGKAHVRAIQAAPELGKVDIQLDGESVGEGVGFKTATPYRLVEPGKYDISVQRAGGGGAPLASKSSMPLTAGASETAFVIGSSGEKVRLVVATDTTATPRRAPETGLGGLADDDGPNWALVALAALLAGSLGGAASPR